MLVKNNDQFQPFWEGVTLVAIVSICIDKQWESPKGVLYVTMLEIEAVHTV